MEEQGAAFARRVMVEEVGLYIHIPFCLRKCRYCDFVSFVGQQGLWRPYLDVVLDEIAALPPLRPRTLYVGGGTPTVWPTSYLVALMQAARRAGLPDDAEATVEANPGTLTLEKAQELRGAGYNRLSLGVQSTSEANLRLLGRVHDYNEAQQAVRWARQAGFVNLSIDLIYGLPGQQVRDWQMDLERALSLKSEHLSAYALSLEPGTPLTKAVESGALPQPEDDVIAEMYEATEDLLADAGYEHYEISNWARRRRNGEQHEGEPLTCKHNLIYWRNEPYVGLGVAAHSFLAGKRVARISDLEGYIAGRPEERLEFVETIGSSLEMSETAILGLRLVSGLERKRFRQRFGTDPLVVFREPLLQAEAQGLVAITPDAVCLTRRGRLLSNEVFQRLLPE